MEWRTGVDKDEVGHTGANELFRGIEVRPILYNGFYVKSSRI